MRVLVLSKYDRLAASARYRFLQYAPYLAQHGIELVLSPLFDDRYLRERFSSGKAPPVAVVRAYLRRLWALLSAHRFELAVLHYELFPYLPGIVERGLAARRIPYVYDFDDAIFHMYDQHRSGAVRLALGQKLGPAIAGARAVMAASRYLAQYAQRYNARVHVVPTVVDMARYAAKPPAARGPSSRPFTVGWIGSPSTTAHLESISDALTELATEGPVRLIATGARPLRITGVDVQIRPWSETREVADLHEADVGVVPLPDEPWSRGKSAFKLIQYMAVGLPTVASPVGANVDVLTEETGLLASTTPQWVAALRLLRNTPSLRNRLGRAGRERVVEAYSLASQQERVRQILEAASVA